MEQSRFFKIHNILTVDLEEWYHPEYVKERASSRREERIHSSLEITLNLLDRLDAEATFFIVGELAEQNPEIIDCIRDENHEIAFHGYDHEPLWNSDPKKLLVEINRFNSIVREKCAGFRAPSFSLNNRTKWALKVLEDCGYTYDSSLFPARTPLYGVSGAPTAPYRPSFENIVEQNEGTKLWEFPLLVYRISGIRVPVAGGFYMRFFPVNLIVKAIRKLNQRGFPAVVFFHNWELDPETPRLKLGLYRHFVTYHKLKTTPKKLEYLLSKFKFTSAKEYINTYLS